jgi:hypothetical protein
MNRLARLSAMFMLLQWSFVSSGLAQQPDCSKFIVLDTESVLSDTYYLNQSRKAFCSQSVHSRAEATAAGLQLGIPVPVGDAILDVNISGNYSNNNWDTWKQAFCDVQQQDTELRQQIATKKSTFANASKTMVEACLKVPGLHGFITPRRDRKSAAVTLQYEAYQGETAKVLVANFSSGASTAMCNAAEKAVLLKDALVNRVPRVVSCGWNPDETLAVTVNSNRGALDLRLDPVPLEPTATANAEERLVPVLESDLKTAPPPDACGAEAVRRTDDQGRWDLALLKTATASAYSEHSSGKFPASQLIDGMWDNCRSWIAADNQPTGSAWIDLGAVYLVEKIALTNLKHPFSGSPSGDRFISKATVFAGMTREDMHPTLASLPDGPLPIDPNLAGRKVWDVGGIRARYIRIDIQSTLSNSPPRLDEVEIFGKFRVVRPGK